MTEGQRAGLQELVKAAREMTHERDPESGLDFWVDYKRRAICVEEVPNAGKEA